ncbi:MAG TPA: hypothetical protein PLX89_27895 [Verrucomicrobiota bacterium]|nr:hypothetical protein [Verrucomicrobiota bacterium]
MASSNERNDCWHRSRFPPWTEWEKGHDRLERRRLARVGTTPEAIGLTGCRQVILVEREVIELNPKPPPAKPAAAQLVPQPGQATAPPPSQSATPVSATTTTAAVVPKRTPLKREEHLYATSYAVAEHDPTSLLEIIRGHWSAIENGTHHRRDVTFGEDRCRVAQPNAAAALATLRNLAIGAYELACAAGRTTAATLSAWCRQQTFTTAYGALNH